MKADFTADIGPDITANIGPTPGAVISEVVSVVMSAVCPLPIAPGGFEPPFSDPKSDVLPLDEGADVLAAS